jgi:chorismate dehydratase
MYRFAVLPYLNAVPLVQFLPMVCPVEELIYCKPRETLCELVAGKVDAALIPVVDYFGTQGLETARGLGICADGGVESVLLQSKYPLSEVHTVALDPESKTSNILAKVLLKNHFRMLHDIKIGPDVGDADAQVIIGDRALCAESALESYDLAAEWKRMTGLPFVFAVWAYRTEFSQKLKLSRILRRAKEAGVDAIGRLSRSHAARLGLSEVRCRHYLTCCIYYDIGPEEKAGMQLFRELSRDLIDRSPETSWDKHSQIRRIVRNEHSSQGIEPVCGPLI